MPKYKVGYRIEAEGEVEVEADTVQQATVAFQKFIDVEKNREQLLKSATQSSGVSTYAEEVDE